MPPVTIRRLATGDAASLTALVERARDAGELLGSSSPHGEWLVRPALYEPSMAAVAEIDGILAGVVLPDPKALVVEPAHRRRGIGRALVEVGLEIEREQGRGALLLGVVPGDVAGHAFLRATGFAYHSTVWDLDLASGVTVAGPAWPGGLTARTFDRARDIGPWVRLFNAAFADHATPLQLDEAGVRAGWGEPPARDEDLLIVEAADGEPVGFCASDPRRLDGDAVVPRGEIWTIGVAPAWQGRGIGRQLLRWGVGWLRQVGVVTVTLSVNGRNPRALGLYESEGFVRTSTRERWARPVEPRA